MIISKKNFNKQIEDAVTKAVNNVNAERDRLDSQREFRDFVDRRFCEISDEYRDDIRYVNERITKLEDYVASLEIRVGKGKMTLNESCKCGKD